MAIRPKRFGRKGGQQAWPFKISIDDWHKTSDNPQHWDRGQGSFQDMDVHAYL